VYRQNDDVFVSLLNKIRENCPDDETLRLLNERYIPDFKPDDKEGYITLTTHNYQAQQINNRKLDELPGRLYTFEAGITGEFPAYSCPTDERLELKTGAQVMFVKNDSSGEHLYYNGKIGKITFIGQDKITVGDEFGHEITVNRETWQNMKYTVNEETQDIAETIIGSFSQYPLKTAWAITIHKSQGLTFDKAIIDAAAAFSHGQVYVALSRCKTLKGMVLTSRINRNALINDMQLDRYNRSLMEKQANDAYLQTAGQAYFLRLVLELFDFEPVQQRLQYVAHLITSHLYRLYPEWSSRYSRSRDDFRTEVTEVGNRFQQQLRRMIEGNPSCAEDENIQERVRKGTEYFLGHIEKYGAAILKGFDLDMDNKETLKLLTKASNSLKDEFLLKWAVLKICRNGFQVSRYLSAKAKAQMEPPPAPKRNKKEKALRKSKEEKEEKQETAVGDGDILHPVLYGRIKDWRYELATAKGLPPYTILQQKALLGIANLLPSGSRELLMIPGIGKKVLDNYGKELLKMIDKYREDTVKIE
jgi:ATP-dependent exoDNAse (exonuclease V) alpha subunit